MSRARKPNESFEEYRRQLKLEKKREKIQKRGSRLVFNSSEFGTYEKSVHGSLKLRKKRLL